MENEKQFIERLLNQGLARRGQNQPAPGFETRILSRLRQDSASPLVWTRSWQFALSLAAAATFAVSAAIILRNPAKNRLAVAPTFRPAGAGARGDTPAVTQVAMNAGRGDRARNRGGVQKVRPASAGLEPTVSAPRLRVFPSPAPLTEEEKILISLVQRNDRQALDALAESLPPPGPPAPLVIKPIVIKPLPPPAPLASEADESTQTLQGAGRGSSPLPKEID